MFIRTLAPLLVVSLLTPGPQSPRASDPLAATVHAALPSTASELWLVPSDDDVSERSLVVYEPLTDAVAQLAAGDAARALALLNRPSLAATPLADYVAYYTAVAQLRLARAEEAARGFDAILDRRPAGYVAVAAMLGAAEAAVALGQNEKAISLFERLAVAKATVNEDVLAKLARTAALAGEHKKAAEAWVRVYYEYPLTDAATEASTALGSMQDQIVRNGYKADLGRAAVLFGARRYTDARAAYAALRAEVSGDDRELVDLRIAECDFFLKRHAAAIEGLTPYVDRASRVAEARFFYLSALREQGRDDAYIERTRALVSDFPDSSWSEEALNNLGTFYILENDDESAATVFRELYEKFPTGTRAERAAWKYGWWKYKNGEYAETVRVFEAAAAGFPRSDYRPSFLYWSARAHGKLGEGTQAEARMRLVHTDYGNSYYGRLAESRLSRAAAALPSAFVATASQQTPATETQPLPSERTIRLLLATGLYDDALNELRFAQRAWGTSPVVDATIAWVYHQKGDLRRAITLMRRAYPQHLTATGQELPAEILQVIFPLTYWDSIRRHAAARNLDPYLVAALIAQESTFDPGVRSAANAWGLMQIVPATGRRLARSVGIRRFSTPMLTDAETNIRLGTLYFSRLVEQFGGTYYALASYNAGESRVVRWKAERPGLDQDEFIDDIPFPETQNYVKRILGTAEDYRMLYGKGGRGKPIPAGRYAHAIGVTPAAAVSQSTTTKKATAKKTTTKKKKKGARS